MTDAALKTSGIQQAGAEHAPRSTVDPALRSTIAPALRPTIDPALRAAITHVPYHVACARNGFALAAAETLIAAFLSELRPVPQPGITHTLGIPGAGKSTFARASRQPNRLHLNFDDVMEKMPVYQQDKLRDGNDAAFNRWTDCAREIGYEILFRAAAQHLDIFFDHSGARADHVALLAALRDAGYRVNVVMFDIDLDLAIERAAGRDRFVPAHFYAERQQALAALLPQYRALADEYAEFRASRDGVVQIS